MRAQTSSAELKPSSTRHAELPYAPRAGATLGRWRLVEPLACGATAHVWRGVDASGESAALKLPARGRGEALRAEHAVLATAAHPNLVRPLELIEVAGRPFALVLEIAEGGDLVPLLGAPARHWLGPLRGAVHAVLHLHACGLAHRDLKARNVLLAADGSARLIDLESAAGVDAIGDSRRGTTAAHRPARTAATGREIDAFALAVLVYELVTGGLPFGIAGRRGLDQPIAPWIAPTPMLEAVMAAAAQLLAGDGRAPRGLSTLADVIESAAAEADEYDQ